MTLKLYFTSRDLTATAAVTRIDTASGRTVFLDRTIFHPQGGGQKSDTGTINGVRLLQAKKADADEVAHSVDPAASLKVGDTVALAVDAEPRKLHARLHSAGHLLAAVAPEVIPGVQAVAGHHWPGEARVEFTAAGETVDPAWAPALAARLAQVIATDLPIEMTDGISSTRIVTIGPYVPVPCGGTHVATLRDIGSITVRNIQIKKGTLKIGYDVA